jgi:predicted metalloprotease with PDZ domain
MKNWILFAFLFLVYQGFAQNPITHWTDGIETHYDERDPVIRYILSIDSTNLGAYFVQIQLEHIPDSFQVAMAVHPEIDDHPWRNVKAFSATSKKGTAGILRLDSGLWQINAAGGEVLLKYQIQIPVARPGYRAAWKPFLSPTGALVGDLHSFLYLPGHESAPSHIEFKIPIGWQIVTGLEPTVDPYVFFAPNAFILMDCPVLTGKLRIWPFLVEGVPHRVAYWPSPQAKNFDTAILVRDIAQVIGEASKIFGRLPYRDYSFLFQDNAYGALEHNNSVTIGIPSSDLADRPRGYLEDITHEYFHNWNIIRIHPEEFGELRFQTGPFSKGLWWSEGMTMFYSDLLLRRAGLPPEDTTRVKHLENLIRRYYGNPGNHLFSAEKVSEASFAPDGMLGDYDASTHLQGELLGAMLDLIIRDQTDGKKSIDEVMRMMMIQYSGSTGFNGKDVERILAETCQCSIDGFFEHHIRGNQPIGFDHYLRLIGLRIDTVWEIVKDKQGKPSPDLRVYSWVKPGDSSVRIGITDPGTCWGKAGIHTGDILLAVNGSPIKTSSGLWSVLSKLSTGDEMMLKLESSSGMQEVKLRLTGYYQPAVHITQIAASSAKQRRLYSEWSLAK